MEGRANDRVNQLVMVLQVFADSSPSARAIPCQTRSLKRGGSGSVTVHCFKALWSTGSFSVKFSRFIRIYSCTRRCSATSIHIKYATWGSTPQKTCGTAAPPGPVKDRMVAHTLTLGNGLSHVCF